MATKIRAVIDLGTNTFNLLIGKLEGGKLQILHSEKEGVALGMGGINSGELTEEAMNRAIVTLKRYVAKSKDLGAESIRMIGTSAIRDAKNQADFIDRVRQETGVEIEVVTGMQEAELIYQGVKWSYDFEEPALIMDIGGGSTEFIHANKEGVLWADSFNIGVSRVFQMFTFSDPLSPNDIASIRAYFEQGVSQTFKELRCDLLIGSSGTFETLYEMAYEKPFQSKIDRVDIELEEIKRIAHQLIASTQAERDKHDWIVPIRKKMAPIAAVKILWIIEMCGIKQCIISPASLKEGALK